MSLGQQNLDRLYANAAKRDALDRLSGVPKPEVKVERVYGGAEYYRDAEDDE